MNAFSIGNFLGWARPGARAAYLGALATAGCLAPAIAQQVPASPDQVARPGGTIPGAPRLALVKVADGFHDPVGVTAANDGSGRIFVVERVGRVRIVGKDGKVAAEPFLDLTNFNPLGSDVQTGFVEQGLWSIALHPKFKENHYVYVHYASLPFNGASMVVRFTVDPASPDRITKEQLVKSAKVLMNIPQPYYNHYGGMITFGPDGKLYIGKGDGGWEGDPLNAGQDLTVLWAKILRIDVDTADDVPYSIPKDNPYARADVPQLMSLFGITEKGFAANQIKSRPETWAYGLRNPYSFHFDGKSGDLFIADVGQNHWEEIDWQPASSKGGENYGWKFNQASHCHPLTGPDDKCPIVGVLPVAEYPHQEPYPGAQKLKTGWGCSAQGLGVANYAGMTKTYLVGDWCSGRLFGIAWDAGASKWTMQELLQTALQFTAGNVDADGNVLATNCVCFYTEDKGPTANPPGSLWRIVPADQVPAGAEVARTRPSS
ncbi:MAG: PQQ-dependent sugar dehydrogenase [Burkholderiaceae bacterium]|nr:PQQ-dependent sugar dehydrogenase [Burkholderiaceae bacterium]